MAVNDSLLSLTNIANGAIMNIATTAPEEGVIHNIFTADGSKWELYITQASNTCLIGTYYTSLRGEVLRVKDTANVYYDVKNVSGAPLLVGYSGVVVK